jgi:hypothetical protein
VYNKGGREKNKSEKRPNRKNKAGRLDRLEPTNVIQDFFFFLSIDDQVEVN